MGCDDGNIQWMYTVFGDCVYNGRDVASFVIGLISLICWVVVGWPQMRDNYTNQSGESVSVPFLLFWGIGDVANVIGCILTEALPTQLFIGIWYCITAAVLIFQVYYYRWRTYVKLTKGVRINDDDSTRNSATLPFAPIVLFSIILFWNNPLLGSIINPGHSEKHFSSRSLLSINNIFSGAGSTGDDSDDSIGLILGWVSAFFYVSSRIPQIYKNYQSKSTEGLSLTMFLFCLLGNITYAVSIILRDLTSEYINTQLPWVIGSLGTLGFDGFIYLQFRWYAPTTYQAVPTSD